MRPNTSSHNMVPTSTQPLTEMSTRNLPGRKGLPAHKADNLTANCEPMSIKCGIINVLYSFGPPRPITWIVHLAVCAPNNFGVFFAVRVT
jgi:hypothetical protein